jgi:hypothetical protein
MQTALILTEAPLATRSRVMGIVTMCIGTGPLGVLTIGVLSEQLGPSVAILIMAGLGVGGLSLVWAKLIGVRRDVWAGPLKMIRDRGGGTVHDPSLPLSSLRRTRRQSDQVGREGG